jgi:hypothetical protein
MKKYAVVLVALALVFAQHMAFAQTRGDSGFIEGGAGTEGRSNSLYHLLILDRSAAVNGDIRGISQDSLLYKVKHGRTGYLIALYKVSQGGQTAILPPKGYVVLDLVTNRKSTIKEFVDSALIREYVTESSVLARLRNVLQ